MKHFRWLWVFVACVMVFGCITIGPGPGPDPIPDPEPPVQVPVIPAGQFVGVNLTDLWVVMPWETVCHDAVRANVNYLGWIVMSDCVEGRMPESGTKWTKANWQAKPDEMRAEVRRILKDCIEVAAQHKLVCNITIQRNCNGDHIPSKVVDPMQSKDFNAWLLNWADWLLATQWTIRPHVDPLAEYGEAASRPVINFLRKLDNTPFICVGSYRCCAEPGWFEMMSCHVGKGGTPARGYSNIAEPDNPTWVAAAFPSTGPNLAMIQADTERWIRNKNSVLVYAYNQPYSRPVMDAVGKAVLAVYGK